MPALFKRPRRSDDDDVEAHVATPSIAALIADHLEASADEPQPVSHRAFREHARDRGRTQDEFLATLGSVARQGGRR